jgi:hypothetical protein
MGIVHGVRHCLRKGRRIKRVAGKKGIEQGAIGLGWRLKAASSKDTGYSMLDTSA